MILVDVPSVRKLDKKVMFEAWEAVKLSQPTKTFEEEEERRDLDLQPERSSCPYPSPAVGAIGTEAAESCTHWRHLLMCSVEECSSFH